MTAVYPSDADFPAAGFDVAMGSGADNTGGGAAAAVDSSTLPGEPTCADAGETIDLAGGLALGAATAAGAG
jgi:hypothetical protein